ncbi:hypothetical protein L198_04941 [Cryptococcus wingfieldii CBS 7118]|uniref:25S rRNA (uridine-N(3))-methyltransferase BMT5-like domain-containing protein n=1 Tax=Cryptococcus wingfieldii CBS 7118 TaxID=1295528 RepID=A0A1E3J3V5_9TREE|nr:hypothetical protein L198_04941 [Cryptococcus wingfieldii CBS 7118]ODN94796.1 hypothetical protein L198_04941 [Cryptococcus wingfieldii CBS 7118]
MGKLKAALANQQFGAAKAAAKKRASAAEEAKKQSIKASVDGVKKGKKRAKAKAGPSAGPVNGSEGVLEGKGKGREKPPTIPIDPLDTVLLLGEANFSYTLALLAPPHNLPPHQILATVYDSEAVTLEKYPDAAENVKTLREKGVRVEFGVDAGALEKCKAVGKGRRWSRVVFNFPHVGAGIKDQDRNVLTNQHMLLRFFRSVEPLLTDGPTHMPLPQRSNKKGKKQAPKAKRADSEDPESELSGVSDVEDLGFEDDSLSLPSAPQAREFTPPTRAGSVLITLLTCLPYTLWCLPQLAARPPSVCPGTNLPQPRYTLLRSFEFKPAAYQGYAHRRTIGWKEGLSKGENEEIMGRKGVPRTYEFVRSVKDE